jgi:phospholipid/cholesterol/gamma-HCH transport system ATP-binding protein
MAELLKLINIDYFVHGIAVLNGLSLSIHEGEALAVAGAGGSGKTALLDICAGVYTPEFGSILWNGENIVNYNDDEKTAMRMSMGYVFQNYALVHNFTIFDNIALPLRYHSRTTEKKIRDAVNDCMELVGLHGVNTMFSNELNITQLKKAALARAIITRPRLLLADELITGCDLETQQTLVNVIHAVRMEHTTAVLITCSDTRDIQQLECPSAVLHEGKLIGSKRLPPTDNPQPSEMAAYQELV